MGTFKHRKRSSPFDRDTRYTTMATDYGTEVTSTTTVSRCAPSPPMLATRLKMRQEEQLAVDVGQRHAAAVKPNSDFGRKVRC